MLLQLLLLPVCRAAASATSSAAPPAATSELVTLGDQMIAFAPAPVAPAAPAGWTERKSYFCHEGGKDVLWGVNFTECLRRCEGDASCTQFAITDAAHTKLVGCYLEHDCPQVSNSPNWDTFVRPANPNLNYVCNSITLSCEAKGTAPPATRVNQTSCAASCGADLPTIMPMGDSITFGCGYNAKAPGFGLECSATDGSYRAELYNLLTAANKKFKFVGSASSGPSSLPTAFHQHEGHSGIRIDQMDQSYPWKGIEATHVLMMLGTNDIWHQNATTATMQTRMHSLLAHVFATMPKTTVWLASITEMAGNSNASYCEPATANCDGHSCCCGCKFYWPAMVAGLNDMLKSTAAAWKQQGKKVAYVPMHEASGVCSNATGADDCCHSYHVHPTKLGYGKMAKVWFDSIKDSL
jgi:lysophospholipase L1-like esterase